MSIRFRCPKCKEIVLFADRYGGRQCPCPECGRAVSVPFPPTPQRPLSLDDEEDDEREDEQPAKKKNETLHGCLIAVGLLIVGGAAFSCYGDRQTDKVKKADADFAAGRVDEAVAVYKDKFSYAPNKPETLGRIIEHEVAKGNSAEVRKWIEQGLQDGINPEFKTDAARNLHATVKRERDEVEAKRKAEEQAKVEKRKAEQAAREQKEKDLEAKREKYGSSTKAAEMARTFVKRQLTFPAEARFHLLPKHDPPEVLNADGSWTVYGGVTGKNGFGVKAKMVYTVRLKLEGNTWKEIDCVLVEDSN